jgi:hypothetical protein
MAKVKTDETIIFQFGLLTTEYTLRSSMTIKAENVIVTMFVNDSLKKMTVASMMMHP